MPIEVIVLKGPENARLNVLQQNLWDFDVIFNESDTLEAGQVGIEAEKLLLGGLPGQRPIQYSLQSELRHWREAHAKAKKKSSLLKALGIGRGDKAIDATFGLGKDSCQMMSAGVSVSAYERVPELFFLARACQLWEEIPEDRLKLNFGSITENPQGLPIYFDPMFSDGSDRKAKSGKGMQVFHQLVGADNDAISEAERLRQLTNRLVIKRTPKAPQLLDGRNSDWTSKAVRFDLYL